MLTFPAEVWIMIIEMVIEDGIIRLDQCDHITFPYDHVFFSPELRSYRFYGSYCRLRLVCRSFNALLGTRPHWDLHISSFPFPMSIRALYITPFDRSLDSSFQQLLADTSRCERLICLEVSYQISRYSRSPDISEFLSAGERRAFPNVRRLALCLVPVQDAQRKPSFWARLNRGFPQLVTLAVEGDCGPLNLEEETNKVVTFERLEILYFRGDIIFLGCRFPRLRLASVQNFSNQPGLPIFRGSSHLACLLIRSSYAEISIDVASFSRLRVLSLREDRLYDVVPLDGDHPLEHLWLYMINTLKNPRLVDEIVKRVPRILRITMDFSSVMPDRRAQRIQEFKKMRLDLFGLDLRPINHGDSLVVIE